MNSEDIMLHVAMRSTKEAFFNSAGAASVHESWLQMPMTQAVIMWLRRYDENLDLSPEVMGLAVDQNKALMRLGETCGIRNIIRVATEPIRIGDKKKEEHPEYSETVFGDKEEDEGLGNDFEPQQGDE